MLLSADRPDLRRTICVYASPWMGLHRQQIRGGSLRQPTLSTRISDYRCSLPGLAGFATYRREEPTEATIIDGGERGIRTLGTVLAVHTLSRRAP